MRDYHNKWGYGYREIIKMPRQEFVLRFGQRYANLSYCQFKRTIRNETPHRIPMAITDGISFKQDYPVNKKEYKATQLGSWDSVCVVI